jgi:membrane-associated protease RseP (regulator of RpoE activity)
VPSDEPANPIDPPIDPLDHYEQFIPKPLPPPHGRLWVQLLLLVLTFITTTLAGSLHYYAFMQDLASADLPRLAEPPFTAIVTDPTFYIHGLWYSLTILAILGCHEMGHYVMCLRYGVIATRPFFLPVPPVPFMTGTLGAFIRIKSRIPTKIALFDIGIAGPIAGFVVAVPMLFAGLAMSRIDRLPQDASSLIELGEPLMFKFAAFLVWGHVGSGSSINMHPMAFAAWFGLLATALNLFPISQLDGGHIAYAVFGRRSTIVSLVMISVAVGLTTFVSLSWIVWTVLTIVMLFVVGPHHPPTLDDETPLDGKRLVLAAIALGMLIVCFTPAPIGPFIGTQ